MLDSGYDEQLSEKFAVAPRSPADYHRAPKGYDLAAIFCLEEERTVLRDWTVRFENQFFQLESPHKNMSPRGKVLVQRYLDGSLHFRYREQEVALYDPAGAAAAGSETRQAQTKTKTGC